MLIRIPKRVCYDTMKGTDGKYYSSDSEITTELKIKERLGVNTWIITTIDGHVDYEEGATSRFIGLAFSDTETIVILKYKMFEFGCTIMDLPVLVAGGYRVVMRAESS